MIRRMIGVVLALLAGGCGGSGSSDNGAASPPAETRNRVVFFGDSLTSGYRLSGADAYPALVQQRIEQEHLLLRSYNMSTVGDTSADGLDRIGEALASPVAIFVLALGANDAEDRVPAAVVESNLQQILDRVLLASPGVRLIVAGIDLPALMSESQRVEYGRMYQHLAAQNDALLIPDLLAGVAGVDELNLPDGIHPNAAGHQAIAETVWAAASPIFAAP